MAEKRREEYKGQNFPAVHSLLIPGRDGVQVLKSWLTYAVDKYQPRTVQSYLISIRLYYKFLSQDENHESMPDLTIELLTTCCALMTSQSSAQKRNVVKRKLEKYDEYYRKILSSENHQVCHGSQHVNAVKQLATVVMISRRF